MTALAAWLAERWLVRKAAPLWAFVKANPWRAIAIAALLLAGLLKRGIYVPRPGWLGFTGRIAVALALMATLLAVAVPRVDWVALRAEPLLRIACVLGLVAAAALVYLGTLAALGLRLRQFVRRSGDSR